MRKVGIRRLLAVMLCMLMVVSVIFSESGVTVSAADTASVHFNDSQLTKADLYYKLGDAAEVAITSGNLEIPGIANGTSVAIKAVPKDGNPITGVQAKEGSWGGSPADGGASSGDSTSGFIYTFTADSRDYYIELMEGVAGPSGKTRVNFGGGSWTVGEVTVTSDRNGTLELNDNDEIILTNFNADTMEVKVASSDGFQTTLNVIGGKTKLANKTNDGGLPSDLTFSVQAKGAGGGPSDPPTPGGDPNIFVETNQPEMIGELKIDGRGVTWNSDRKSGGANVTDAASYTLVIQLEFGKAASSITINGVTYTSESSNVTVGGPAGDLYTISGIAPNADKKFIISFEEAQSTISTIIWTYDVNDPSGPQGDTYSADALVTHGKVEIVSIKRGGTILYADGNYASGVNPETDKVSVDIAGQRGYVRLEKGDDIVIKLIPEYGYQLGSASINDRELAPKSSDFSDVSTFTLNDVQGQMHFSGVFVKKDDVITNSADVVSTASIKNGENAASSGNLSLTVAGATADEKSLELAKGNDAESKYETMATLDLTLDNIVSMGPSKGNWTQNITEFTSDITVNLSLSGITVGADEELVVVRKHGDSYEIIEGATLSGSTLAVPTNKFSTYSIVKKTSEKKEYSDIDTTLGEVKDITQSSKATGEANKFAAKIANASNLATLLGITDAEKALGVNVWIKLLDASGTMPAADKAAIIKAAGDYKVGLYLDLSLFKKVGTTDATAVHNLNGVVKLGFKIPSNLQKSDRIYKIVRIHEGVATVLNAEVDSNYNLTFETDKFSSYALIYEDNDPTISNGNVSTSITSNVKVNSKLPKTGDMTPLALYWGVLFGSMVAFLCTVVIYKKRRKKS